MAIVDSTTCEAPGRSGIPVDLQERNENFIGGEWIARVWTLSMLSRFAMVRKGPPGDASQ